VKESDEKELRLQKIKDKMSWWWTFGPGFVPG